MLAPRLINLIEMRAERIAESLMPKLETSEKLEDYQRVPPSEVRRRATEIYEHLSDWLLTRTEAEVEKRFTEIGARRAAQGVALSSLVWALSVTKEHLWEWVRREGLVDRHIELREELELMQLVEQFFDRATYFATRGYEKSRPARAA